MIQYIYTKKYIYNKNLAGFREQDIQNIFDYVQEKWS